MSAAALLALWAHAACGAPGPLATSPCIVPTGHVQLEGDFASVQVSRTREGAQTSLDWGPVVIKIPVSEAMQLETMVGPLDDSPPPSSTPKRHNIRLEGVGGWLKLNVLRGNRCSTALRLGFETNPSEGGSSLFVLGTPLAVALAGKWSLTLDPELDKAPASAAIGFQSLVALCRPMSSRWTGLVEVSSVRAVTKGAPTLHNAIAGLDYVPPGMSSVHIDVGAGVGINRAARGVLAYVGYSVRL